MRCLARQLALVLLAAAAGVVLCSAEDDSKKKHHHHHHHHHGHHKHHKHHGAQNSTAAAAAGANTTEKVASRHEVAKKAVTSAAANTSEKLIINKMKELEKDLSSNRRIEDLAVQMAHLKVNAPLPKDFKKLFARGISEATGCRAGQVKVVSSMLLPEGKVDQVAFSAPRFAALEAERQAADPDSALARGPLRLLLMARDEDEEEKGKEKEKEEEAPPATESAPASKTEGAAEGSEAEATGTSPQRGVDVDTEMPFGDLEPFGREDTAQELTEDAIEESNRMVDQLERAEVAEEKRAVFRALTRLRGAAITSFDGVARAQTSNIDGYNQAHKWRGAHPLHHLAEDEADISKWAFPEAEF